MTGRGAFTRRRFLTGAGGAAAGVVLTGGLDQSAAAAGLAVPAAVLPAAVAGLPARQHAWNAKLKLDRYGNRIAPRHARLLFFGVRDGAGPASARLLEAELRKLEHAHRWGPEGLLFTIGWAPSYFERVAGAEPPIPRARALSDFEQPKIDPYDVCLHLAADELPTLVACERALTRALAPILRLDATRTGFTGAGLPAANQRVSGIPSGNHVTRSTPLYMGFKSSLKKNQASEDAVTIADGDFAQGTTMTVSYMTLTLDSWYQDLDDSERVARMYSPQTTPHEVERLTTDAESNPGQLQEAINRYGVIGHSQSSARARRHGKPIILRRDFDTADGGRAGVHFVSLQRSIADFVATRTAMNQPSAQLQNPSISDTVNNGINEFIFVENRANYLLPARAQRSFPLLPGRDRLL